MHRKITALLLFLTLAFASIAPSFAGGYGFPKKEEDAAAASGDDLCVQGAVIQKSNDTALAADGDYTVPTCNDVGNLKVQIEPSRKATYVCATPKFTPIASATDIWQMYGSASKTIKILKLEVMYSASSASYSDFFVIKRSTANSGGTATTPTICPLDSAFAAATGVVKYYASGSNPTTGTTVSNVAAAALAPIYIAGTTTGVMGNAYHVLYSADTGGALVLRGTGEGIVVNLNGATLGGTGPYVGIRVTFSEE